jgi:hypothetical protein
MGTRGHIGFKVDGKIKQSYNHFDSYPEKPGLGFVMIDFVKGIDDVDAVKAKVRELVIVNERSKPTDEHQELAKEHEVSDYLGHGDYYGLLREFQGDPDGYLSIGLMPGDEVEEFDPWEEYGYRVDLDNQELQFWENGRHSRTFGFEFLKSDPERVLELMVKGNSTLAG